MVWVCPGAPWVGLGFMRRCLETSTGLLLAPTPYFSDRWDFSAGNAQNNSFDCILRKLQKPQGNPGSQVGFLGMLGVGEGMAVQGFGEANLRGGW